MKLSLPSAAAGAVLASASLLVVRVAVVGPVEVPGMPAAADMVNGNYVGNLTFGAPVTLFNVPSDSSLVLTSVVFRNDGQSSARVVNLVESTPSGSRLIHRASNWNEMPLPVALAPGSELQIDLAIGQSGTEGVQWVGYLER